MCLATPVFSLVFSPALLLVLARVRLPALMFTRAIVFTLTSTLALARVDARIDLYCEARVGGRFGIRA
eukprot:9718363-Lingulodinium_polyedra.AAC.1